MEKSKKRVEASEAKRMRERDARADRRDLVGVVECSELKWSSKSEVSLATLRHSHLVQSCGEFLGSNRSQLRRAFGRALVMANAMQGVSNECGVDDGE